jgi:hypothetical protein
VFAKQDGGTRAESIGLPPTTFPNAIAQQSFVASKAARYLQAILNHE